MSQVLNALLGAVGFFDVYACIGVGYRLRFHVCLAQAKNLVPQWLGDLWEEPSL
jgi:hypothetical protein